MLFSPDQKIFHLELRVKKIEEFIEKKDKKFKDSLTLNQKLLILVEFGIIDDLLERNSNKSMVAKLLALLLEVSEQNLRDELSHYKIKKGSNVYTDNNMYEMADLLKKYKFLTEAENLKKQADK
jgi:hypothetical protein